MTLIPWLMDAAVRLTILTGVAACLLALFQVQVSTTRLRVWSGVITAALVLPFVQPVVPWSWSLAIPVAADSSVNAVAAVFAPAPAHIPTVDSSPVAITAASTWVRTILAVYLAVAGVLLARLVFGLVIARRLQRDAMHVSDDIFQSARVAVPLTTGLWRQTIILPTAAGGWPDVMQRAVYAHERAHAARRDTLWLAVAHLHRAVYWFHPLSWWLVREMTTLAERASDDAALATDVSPVDYADMLLHLSTIVSATRQRVLSAPWALPMGWRAGRELECRLNHVLDWKGVSPMRRVSFTVLAAAATVTSAVVYTADIRPAAEIAGPIVEAVVPPAAVLPASLTLPAPSVSAPVPRTEALRTDAQRDQRPPRDRAADAPQRTDAEATKRVDPKYTLDAMRARIQGTVSLELSVSQMGSVTAVRVTQSLDSELGLDTQAMSAAAQWMFRPATVNGKAVASTVVITMEFRLH